INPHGVQLRRCPTGESPQHSPIRLARPKRADQAAGARKQWRPDGAIVYTMSRISAFPAGWRRVMTTEMLYQMLRGRIQDGTYPVNEPLPTEAALQEEFKAARGTVRAALQRLADDGLVFLGEGRKRIVQRAAS